MNAAKYIWMNGKFVAWDDAKVHVGMMRKFTYCLIHCTTETVLLRGQRRTRPIEDMRSFV